MSEAQQDRKSSRGDDRDPPLHPRVFRSRRRRTDRRGVALVMVLGAITVLTVFLTELQEETSSELSSALAERDAVRAEYYARSAVNLSRLLIAMEPSIRSSIPFLQMLGLKQLPVWKYQDMVLGPFNDAQSSEAFASLINADATTSKNLGLSGGGHFELTIVDEDSKINLNTAAQNLPSSRDGLARQLMGLMISPENNSLFEGRDMDNQFSDRQTVCGAIIDWADSSNTGAEELATCDVTSNTNTATGTEDNFYEMLGLSYRRKNAAYDSLEELHLVRGISDDFWSTFVDPEPGKPDKRILTVWGQGKINLNTASAQTLFAVVCSDAQAQQLFCNDPTQAIPFLQMLTLAQSFLPPGVPLFSSPKELTGLLENGGQPAQDGKSAQQMPSVGSMVLPMLMGSLGVTLRPFKFQSKSNVERQLGNTSKIFSIYADGVVPGFRKTTKVRIHAVVDFRQAQGLGDAFNAIAGGTQGAQMPPGALDNATRSDPAGNVIYWRVE